MDPEGDIAETAWDVFNIGLGVASLAKNVKDGNVGGALLDAAGNLVRQPGEVIFDVK